MAVKAATAMKKMNTWIIILTCVSAAAGVGVAWISLVAKQREIDAANLLAEKYKNEILTKQTEVDLETEKRKNAILEAQSRYDKLNQKYKNEILLRQAEYDLLNQKYISESGDKLSGQIIGKNSDPHLVFSLHQSTKEGLIYPRNDGPDPAYDLSGDFICTCDGKDDLTVYKIGPVNVPGHVVLSEAKVPFDLKGYTDTAIMATFTTRYSVYSQLLVIAHDGKFWRQGYRIMDLKHKGVKYYVDPDFPFDKSRSGPLLKEWLEQINKGK